MKQTSRRTHRRGFTIVELVIVIAVIAILAAVLIPTFSNVIDKAKDSAAMQEARNAYTEYMVDAATSGNAAGYCVYEADENRFVAIANGSVVGVYDSKEAALAAMVSEPTEELVLTDNDKLWVYGGEAGSGNNGEQVKESLTGKKISFMGDSISTYLNWSNNTTFNTTIGGNKVYYERDDKKGLLSSVHYTWWMKTVEELGLELCVNNSWSGSTVTGNESGDSTGCGTTRTSNLHNDNTGVKPDIIVVYLGANDFKNEVSLGAFDAENIYNSQTGTYTGDLTKFAPAYATMVHKIKSNYPDADLYLCTIDSYAYKTTRDDLSEFNAVIKSIAQYFDCSVIDFYNGTPITADNIAEYAADAYLHPNAKGMNEMYQCVKNALAENYQVTEADDDFIFDREVIQNLKVGDLTAGQTGVYMYLDAVNEKLSEKTVTRIGVPIKSVADCKANSTITVYVVNSAAPHKKQGEAYTLTIPANRFSDNTVNQWVYFDVKIELGEGQTLAFQANGGATIGYVGKNYAGTAVSKDAVIEEIGGFRVIDVGTGDPGTEYKDRSLLYDIFVK